MKKKTNQELYKYINVVNNCIVRYFIKLLFLKEYFEYLNYLIHVNKYQSPN